MHSKASPVIGVIQKKQLVLITVIHCTNFKELMFYSSEEQNKMLPTNHREANKRTKKQPLVTSISSQTALDPTLQSIQMNGLLLQYKWSQLDDMSVKHNTKHQENLMSCNGKERACF